ncbi:MAG: DUF86 domain-containing protein [Chloroflexi bacterium]|nr:DUF86 domain-containing protein [Chloroflexota bacterium]
MVLKRDSIIERLKELDTVLQELNQYTSLTEEDIRADMSQRWIIERGLIAAASLILDVADHILVGQYGIHTTTYEESLLRLQDKKVISEPLYQNLREIGRLPQHPGASLSRDRSPPGMGKLSKGMNTFLQFAQEILSWLEKQE